MATVPTIPPPPMSESLGLPMEPPTSPALGFGAWASDPRNMAKITPSLVPQPDAPGVNPGAAQGLFSDAPQIDTGGPALPKIDLGMPQNMATPPTQGQDQQNYPDVYGKPYLKNGNPSKWDRVAAGLMGFGGGMRGNPMVGADYIHGLEQHDLNLTGQNRQIYNDRFITPQIDAMTVPAAQARMANTQAQTAHMTAETNALNHPAPPTPQKSTYHAMPDGSIVELAKDEQGKTTANVVYQGTPNVQTDVINKAFPDGPHNVIVNKRTGETIQDLGRKGHEPPTTVINDRSEIQHGRTLLDKAEQTYRTAAQKADSLADMVTMAQHGNKVAAAAQPLEGTLALVTSQGVTRINRNELQSIAGAGSLFDQLAGKVGKLVEGQPIPKDVQDGFLQLSGKLKQASYQTYLGAHDSAVKRYKLDGEEPLPPPQSNAPAGPPAGATHKAPGSDGHMHYTNASGQDLGRAD